MLKAANSTNPLERMKYMLSYLLGGLGINLFLWKSKAPFSPTLGETYQATKDGLTLYSEITSINPPTLNYLIKGPNGLFEIFGYNSNFLEMVGMNEVNGQKEGRNAIKFSNGTLITWDEPNM